MTVYMMIMKVNNVDYLTVDNIIVAQMTEDNIK